MKTLACLIFLQILQVIKGDAPVEQHVDVVASAQLQNLILFTRVEHVAKVSYSYQLMNNSGQTQYPEMDIIFNLTFGQYATIEYNIIVQSDSWYGWLSTWVKIDNVQIQLLRRRSTATSFPSVTASTQFWLEKGTHRLRLFYQCGSIIQQYPSKWGLAYLRLFYFKLNSS